MSKKQQWLDSRNIRIQLPQPELEETIKANRDAYNAIADAMIKARLSDPLVNLLSSLGVIAPPSVFYFDSIHYAMKMPFERQSNKECVVLTDGESEKTESIFDILGIKK